MTLARFALCLFLLLATISRAAAATDSPDEPIASIDGEPIYWGELNLILAERLGADRVSRATDEIRQAAAAILVRRHVAMRSLRNSANESLEAMIKKDFDEFSAELQRRGSNLAQYAKERSADERCVSSDRAWQTAWRQYLKSRMTDANLQKYFQQHRARYDGSRWNVSQIFLSLPGRDPASIQTVSNRMKEVADQLRAAGSVEESFAAAAREHSEAGSATAGGKIGWVENDADLPRSVMQVVRTLKPGEVSHPMQSPLGLHLLLVHEHQAGKLTFEEISDQSQLRRDAADRLFDALVRGQKEANVVWHMENLRPPIPLP